MGSSAISSFGPADQGHGDHDALALPAGELVRVVLERAAPALGMPTSPSISTAPLAAPRPCAMSRCSDERLGDLVPDA